MIVSIFSWVFERLLNWAFVEFIKRITLKSRAKAIHFAKKLWSFLPVLFVGAFVKLFLAFNKDFEKRLMIIVGIVILILLLPKLLGSADKRNSRVGRSYPSPNFILSSNS